MSNAELENLIVSYLEGTATRSQVVRLRDAIKSSPEMQQRFQARLRLHRAQLSFLRHKEDRSAHGAVFGLHRIAQRAGRSFAHLCLLALVFVELRVTIPAEYSGLLCYVEAPLGQDTPDADADIAPVIFAEPVQEAEGALGSGMPDVVSPAAAMPEMMAPVDEALTSEA